MAQDFFSSGFFGIVQPDSTGARGSDSGKSLQFNNPLTPGADVLDTGAPGSAPRATPVDGGATASATDPFGHLNGTDAPPVHGSTGTSQSTGLGALLADEPNPTSTGAGEGHVVNQIRRPS